MTWLGSEGFWVAFFVTEGFEPLSQPSDAPGRWEGVREVGGDCGGGTCVIGYMLVRMV